jgi:hypothetical protein
MALILPAILSGAVHAQSVSVEIQGVTASDAGKKEQNVAESLARFKNVLKDTVFGTFKDAGSASVKPAAGGKDSATIAGYGVDVALIKTWGNKAKVEVTLKHGGKPIGQPISTALTKGEPIMISQLGAKDAPTILIFTYKE